MEACFGSQEQTCNLFETHPVKLEQKLSFDSTAGFMFTFPPFAKQRVNFIYRQN
jgi:hypothetical protein